jgi:hypothetical protein
LVAVQRARFLLRPWWSLFTVLFTVLVAAAWCVWAGTVAIKTGVETWGAQQSGIPAHVVVTGCAGPKGQHCVAIWQRKDGTAEQVKVVGSAERDEAVDVRIVVNRAYQTDLYDRLSGFVRGELSSPFARTAHCGHRGPSPPCRTPFRSTDTRVKNGAHDQRISAPPAFLPTVDLIGDLVDLHTRHQSNLAGRTWASRPSTDSTRSEPNRSCRHRYCEVL